MNFLNQCCDEIEHKSHFNVYHMILTDQTMFFSAKNTDLLWPRQEETGFWDFRPGPIQTGLYTHRQKPEFWVYVEEELYYLCRENKGADQLCSYCTAVRSAPLFSHRQNSGFLMTLPI